MVNTTPIHERPTNVTGFNDFFFSYADEVLFAGLWGEMILVTVFIITIVSTLQFGIRRPFAAATFMTWITAILLGILGVVGDLMLTITTVIFLLAFLVNRGDNKAI